MRSPRRIGPALRWHGHEQPDRRQPGHTDEATQPPNAERRVCRRAGHKLHSDRLSLGWTRRRSLRPGIGPDTESDPLNIAHRPGTDRQRSDYPGTRASPNQTRIAGITASWLRNVGGPPSYPRSGLAGKYDLLPDRRPPGLGRPAGERTSRLAQQLPDAFDRHIGLRVFATSFSSSAVVALARKDVGDTGAPLLLHRVEFAPCRR